VLKNRRERLEARKGERGIQEYFERARPTNQAVQQGYSTCSESGKLRDPIRLEARLVLARLGPATDGRKRALRARRPFTHFASDADERDGAWVFEIEPL
jgi:hypothetical protein